MKKVLLTLFILLLISNTHLKAQLFSQTFGTGASFNTSAVALLTNATYINQNPTSSQFSSLNSTVASGGLSMIMNTTVANTMEVVQSGTTGKFYFYRTPNLSNLGSITTAEMSFNLSMTTATTSTTALTVTMGNGWSTNSTTSPTPNAFSIGFKTNASTSGFNYTIGSTLVTVASSSSASQVQVVIFANSSASSVSYTGPDNSPYTVAANTYLVFNKGGGVWTAPVTGTSNTANTPLNSFAFVYAATKASTVDVSNLVIRDPFNSVTDYYYQSGDMAQASNWNTLIAGGGTSPSSLSSITANMHVRSNATLSTALSLPTANLILENSASLTVNSGGSITLGPTSGLTIITGSTLNLNGNHLTLQSNSSSTASVNQINGSLTNATNVTVQRYVGTSQQWRMVGFPLTSSTSISASALAALYGSGYNAYVYNEGADDQTNYGSSGTANAGWTAFTGSATTTSDKGILLSGGSPTSTVSATGTLNTGTQSIALAKAKNGWNLIANPFASSINWTTIIANNPSGVNNAIYRYDPATTAYATYVSGVSTGNQSNVIENGASFFVDATAAGNLSIQESDKTSFNLLASLMGIRNTVTIFNGLNNTSNNSDANSIIKLALLKDGESKGDEVVVRWGVDPATDGFDGKYDAYDMGRVQGADLSVIGNDGTAYSIFHGSALQTKDKEQREILIGTKNMVEGNYNINTNLLSAMYDGNDAYLMDHYTNQTTLISANSASYPFMVTSDAKSASTGRFSIVFNYKAIDNTNPNMPVVLLNNPSNGNIFTLYSKNNYTQLQYQVVDNSGRLMQTGLLSNVAKGSTHQINAGTATTGNYFIKLNGDGNNLPVLKAIKN